MDARRTTDDNHRMPSAKEEIQRILASSEDDTQVLSALFRFGERWEESNALEEEVALIEARFPEPMLAAANRWMDRAFAGEDDPRLRLCNRCIVTGPYAYKIRGKKFSDEHIENFCRSSFLGGVRYFTTTVSHKFGPRTFTAFSTAKTLLNLRELDLSHTKPGKSGLAALSSGPSLSTLATLRLYDASIDGKQLEAFCKGSTLASLTHLVLARNSIGAQGAVALASCPMLSKLESLDLNQCALDLASLEALSKSAHLSRLQTLKIDYNEDTLSGEICETLATATFAPSLRSLDLSYLPVNEAGLAVLMTRASSLAALHLRHTRLSKLDPLLVERETPITKLWLDDCPIDAAQLRALIASPVFSKLTELGVAGTSIGDEGILALAAANLSSLTALNASVERVTRASLQKLVDNPTLQATPKETLRQSLQYVTA